VSFVNKQEDAGQQDRASSGQPIDFDPNDPDVVKVHYDVSAWNFDQRAELSEALADEEIPHMWDGDELVVPEVVEDEVDAMFERLEEILGPFPVLLAADDESTEYGLDEWTEADRAVLTEALTHAEIPHRWEGTTVVVAADAEDAVDDLLDAIEAGELVGSTGEGASGPPEGAMAEMFLAADSLAKDPLDTGARRRLVGLLPQLDRTVPPYGVAARTWAASVDGAGTIVGLIEDDAGRTDPARDRDSDIIGAAQELRTLLRPFI
jgi:hypothetical protein